VADVGIPHPVTTLPNSFAGTDSRAGVGQPSTGAQIGVPHVTVTLSNTFTGTNPAANIGQPNNLGAAIGTPNP
jgi:hypothetical protein